MYTDIHSHILPGIDDGAKNIEETLKLIELLKAQGVSTVFATPHYHAEICSAPTEYLKECSAVLKNLQDNLSDDGIKILQGFEVRFFRGLSQSEEAAQLRLENSNHILIELPPYGIDSKIASEIVDFSLNFRVKPIIAHVERYAKSSKFHHLTDIVKEGFVEAQINCDSLFAPKLRKQCLALIREGYISYIASDTHSLDERPPHFSPAVEFLKAKLGERDTQILLDNSNALIG